MGSITIQNYTTKNPITMIGEEAGVCWGADTSDPEKNYKRGMNCLEAQHGRTFEFPNVYMIIDGYSAKALREYYTHIGCLPTRLQESTRYVDLKNFNYIIPKTVSKNKDAEVEWKAHMRITREFMNRMESVYNIPREDSSMALPICYQSKMVDKRNLRNFIDMAHQRKCARAYWEFRELFNDICNALRDYSEEWKYLVDNYFILKCEYFGYCTEKNSCGRKPKKEDVIK